MIFAGIDIGSTMTKVVIVNEEKMLANFIGPTGPEHRHLAHEVMTEALHLADLPFEALSYVVATGYGRINVPFADKQITEITCHARGVSALFPTARTVIDIGGQDAKGIKLDNGMVDNFVMNDKCAAGTGRFLEVIAGALDLTLADLGELSILASEKAKISNICTIFAEQEVMTSLADGTPVANILYGLHDAIAGRVLSMAGRVGVEREVVFTGGVAKNIGMVQAMESRLGYPVLIAPEPLLTGALGAALMGQKIVENNLARGVSVKRSSQPLHAGTVTVQVQEAALGVEL
ncbi:acyl-CoA dehydratase activase [Desulfocicer niacini]